VPAVQATQPAPPSQTMLVPHERPAAAGECLSVQLAKVLPLHWADPRSQGLSGYAGWHDSPCVQAWHTPFWQSIPPSGPQAVPVNGPEGVQTGTPVVHTIELFWHAPASLQSFPAAQGTQDPMLQTAPASHIVPLLAWAQGPGAASAPPSPVVPASGETVASFVEPLSPTVSLAEKSPRSEVQPPRVPNVPSTPRTPPAPTPTRTKSAVTPRGRDVMQASRCTPRRAAPEAPTVSFFGVGPATDHAQLSTASIWST
jgi:hypothetical protein